MQGVEVAGGGGKEAGNEDEMCDNGEIAAAGIELALGAWTNGQMNNGSALSVVFQRVCPSIALVRRSGQLLVSRGMEEAVALTLW